MRLAANNMEHGCLGPVAVNLEEVLWRRCKWRRLHLQEALALLSQPTADESLLSMLGLLPGYGKVPGKAAPPSSAFPVRSQNHAFKTQEGTSLAVQHHSMSQISWACAVCQNVDRVREDWFQMSNLSALLGIEAGKRFSDLPTTCKASNLACAPILQSSHVRSHDIFLP